MKSLTLTAYSSIILNETYFGLSKAIGDLQSELSLRIRLAQEKIIEYIDGHEMQTEFYIHEIRNTCINICHGNCEQKHYPVVTFISYFNSTGGTKYFVQLVINKDNSVNLTIEENKSEIRICTAKRKPNEIKWQLDLSVTDEEKEELPHDIMNFFDDIHWIIDIYVDTLNKK